jgi:hypothetical protein
MSRRKYDRFFDPKCRPGKSVLPPTFWLSPSEAAAKSKNADWFRSVAKPDPRPASSPKIEETAQQARPQQTSASEPAPKSTPSRASKQDPRKRAAKTAATTRRADPMYLTNGLADLAA